jgi:hypothetical protein
MGESKRRRLNPRDSRPEARGIPESDADQAGGRVASKGGWWATSAEGAVRLHEFRWDPGEHFTLVTFGVPAFLNGDRDDDSLLSAIVCQALEWIKGPPATAPQCCICGRTFLNPVGDARPCGPCFVYLRKGRRDDGVAMAMLHCGEHVRDDEYDDALAAAVEQRLGLKSVAMTRAAMNILAIDGFEPKIGGV